jgi:hypothetical protein
VNKRATAYLAQHGVIKLINGSPEWMLPLDKLQGFLDLLNSDDIVPGNDIQRLYYAQAQAVRSVQEQVAQYVLRSPKMPSLDVADQGITSDE